MCQREDSIGFDSGDTWVTAIITLNSNKPVLSLLTDEVDDGVACMSRSACRTSANM